MFPPTPTSGTVADVHKAVARKVIEITKPEDEKDYKKEVENMKILCNKSHKNIIQYIGDGIIAPTSFYYIDMELCDIDLSKYMNGGNNVIGVHGLPSWNKDDPDVFMIVAIMQQLLSGLAFMHKENKVHRDLDPTNGS
jgi:serine/threonine protein kinase